jgi:hypothetical protein
MYFTTHAVDAGFEIWVQPQVACGQVEYISWDFAHYRQRLADDPTFAQQGGILGMAEGLP